MHTYCQWPIIELAKNSRENKSENKMAASHVVHINTHVRFPWSKKWQTYHVAVPTGNALASQRSIFRENRLNFRPSSAAVKVSIVCGTNNHVKSEMLSNAHTHTHTDTQTKYCNPRCACAPRVNNCFMLSPLCHCAQNMLKLCPLKGSRSCNHNCCSSNFLVIT